MSQQYVDLDNARQQDQAQVMKDIIDAGHCPFCEQNLRRYHRQPIIKETRHWLLTPNQWPYEYTKYHWLAIYREHVTDLQSIEPIAGQELIELFAWLEKKYQLPGGGWCMRFGDSNYSAGSVNHIHAQFIIPDITVDGYQPVRVKLGKSPDKLHQQF